MTAFTDAQADLRLGPDGRLDMDVQCVSCGYNLRGLAPDVRCPECGTAIARSTRGDFLRFCDPDWVEALASGMNWIVAGIIVAFVLGVFGGGAAGLTNKPVYGMIGIVGGLVTLIGYWKVTTADPREPASQGLDARTIVRYGSVLNLVLSLAGQIITPFSLFWKLLVLPSAVLGLVVTISVFVYARRMAMRVPDERLAGQTRIVMWGFVAMSVLTMLLLTAMTVYGPAFLAGMAPPTGGVARGPGAGASSAGLPVGWLLFATLGCAAGVVSLVFSIWALVLLVRYRRAFRQAAQDARASWAAVAVGQQNVGQ